MAGFGSVVRTLGGSALRCWSGITHAGRRFGAQAAVLGVLAGAPGTAAALAIPVAPRKDTDTPQAQTDSYVAVDAKGPVVVRCKNYECIQHTVSPAGEPAD